MPPAVIWDWFWRKRADLPPPGQKQWEENEMAYDELLAGKPVRDTLQALREFL